MCALKLDFAARSWDRRALLKSAAGALAAWPLLGSPRTALARRNVRLDAYPFTLGVACGEPLPDGFVLWTRLAPQPLEGGGMPDENVEVDWEVADDEALTRLVAHGTAVASGELAHSVHVEVTGLAPDRWYFYRFRSAGEVSPVGRARTTPAAGVVPQRLRLAFASCQHYEAGYYTAFRHMAAEDLDLIAHLGDYIYEGAGRDQNVRRHTDPLLDQLVDYRNRHAQYKTDPDLQAAHQRCPWIVTWDDHEVANNYADRTPDRRDETPAGLLQKRIHAYQAYYEHMPLRAAQLPHGPDMQLYRQVSFGQLAQFAVLDTRQYRTDQPCGDGNKPPCDGTYDPQGTLLGSEQERWLLEGLDRSRARWNVLAQQVMMARVDRRPGSGESYSMDQWPGYEVNRQRLLAFFAERPQLNPIVLAGDIHCHWANNLQLDSRDEASPVVATEFVGTSITSGGDGGETRRETAQILAENPFVRFFNNERGYISCDITPDAWTSHYRTVPYVTRPDAPLATRRSFIVEPGRPGANPA